MTDLRAAIHRTDIRGKHLTHEQRVLVCKAFVAMRLVDQQWLQEMVCSSRRDLHTSLLKDLLSTSMFLFSLAYLNFSSVELFEEVGLWLDGHGRLAANFGWSGEVLNILWACVMQGVVPYKALAQLQKCEPPVIGEMEHEVVVKLNDLSVLLQRQHGMNILPPETHSALLRWISLHNQQVLPHDVCACVDDIGRLFPLGHARANVMTAGGVRIDCAVLKNRDGTSVEWPNSVGQELSAAEVEQLQKGGYQPLAIQALGSAWFDLSQNLLGPAVMKCNVLKACGWDVFIISTSEYGQSADKQSFLRAELECESEDGFAVRIPSVGVKTTQQ